jgi:hypothetical protein
VNQGARGGIEVLLATKDGERFIPQKAGWGGGAQMKKTEIHPAERAGWGGGPQIKKREIPPYATRRPETGRKKKAGSLRSE